MKKYLFLFALFLFLAAACVPLQWIAPAPTETATPVPSLTPLPTHTPSPIPTATDTPEPSPTHTLTPTESLYLGVTQEEIMEVFEGSLGALETLPDIDGQPTQRVFAYENNFVITFIGDPGLTRVKFQIDANPDVDDGEEIMYLVFAFVYATVPEYETAFDWVLDSLSYTFSTGESIEKVFGDTTVLLEMNKGGTVIYLEVTPTLVPSGEAQES